MIESATGLILRTRPLTDTSLIVNWLTRDFGRLATVAKGARRPKSAFAGKLDLFYLADFSFQRSQRSELHALREVALRDTRAGIRRELQALEQASYCAALVERTTEMDTPLPEIFELMNGLLEHLSSVPPRPEIIPAFELKLLNALGLQPDFSHEDLPPDQRKIIEVLTNADWPAASRLKLATPQRQRLIQFLHRFLEFHVGHVPQSRTRALGETR
ncbi:MAG TPA: DNA repair protein RecO [Verrucomicrobiae bacterium]|nr:DNA repair protein RecO [Verrucomicrobiae bacterium]